MIVAGTVTGKWQIIQSRTREVLSLHHDSSEPVLTSKFSPDGSKLALLSRAAVHIYSVDVESRPPVRRLGRCTTGQASQLTNGLDWSEDSSHLAANTADRERVVWILQGNLCRLVMDMETVRNMCWASSDCLISWDTLGVWGLGAEAEGAVSTVTRSTAGDVLLAGMELGQVSSFTYFYWSIPEIHTININQ